MNWIDFSKAFEDFAILKKPIIILYTFASQPGAIPIFRTLHNNTGRRVRKVALRSIYMVMAFVLLSSISGYLSIPYKTPELFIYRSAVGVLESDWLMIIGNITVFVCLVFSFPASIITWRLSFFNFFYGTYEYTNLQ